MDQIENNIQKNSKSTMILSFKKQFIKPIQDGSKIHTIREDRPNRWKAGNSIQMATGVRTSKYNMFQAGKCVSTQEIVIWWGDPHIYQHPAIQVDGYVLKPDEVVRLSENDGFILLEDLYKWFSENFTGKIIHWTDKRY